MAKAYITRDSVCAGDDGDAPHGLTIDLPADLTIEHLVLEVLRAIRLPSISGDHATWAISSRIPLAVMAQQWREPRLLHPIPPRLSALDQTGQTLNLHISYFAQQDPETVFNVLRRLQLRPD